MTRTFTHRTLHLTVGMVYGATLSECEKVLRVPLVIADSGKPECWGTVLPYAMERIRLTQTREARNG